MNKFQHQFFHGRGVIIDAAEQHGLVAERDAGVYDCLTGAL